MMKEPCFNFLNTLSVHNGSLCGIKYQNNKNSPFQISIIIITDMLRVKLNIFFTSIPLILEVSLTYICEFEHVFTSTLTKQKGLL